MDQLKKGMIGLSEVIVKPVTASFSLETFVWSSASFTCSSCHSGLAAGCSRITKWKELPGQLHTTERRRNRDNINLALWRR